MPRKYLGRIPKRRRHSSYRQFHIGPNGNRDNIDLSQNRTFPSTNNVDIQSDAVHSSALPNGNNNNHLLIATDDPPFNNNIPIPPVPLNAPSNMDVIIDDNMQQQTDLPTNIQIQNCSSSISSMTTSLFDIQASSSNTDEGSDKTSGYSQFSLTLSAEEKSRRLLLF